MTGKLHLVLKSSAFRVIQTTVSIVIGFLMMPFLIGNLGEDEYGLWVIVGSVVGAYYLLDLGFTQAVTRYVTRYIHQNRPKAANEIISTALAIYSALGVGILVVTIIAAGTLAPAFVSDPKDAYIAQAVLIIAGTSMAFEFPAKAFPGIISAYMRYDVIALARTCKIVADAILIFIFISKGYGLISMALITLCTNILSTGFFIAYSSSIFKELKLELALINRKTLNDVFNFSKWVFLFDLNTILKDKIDIWFIAYFHGSSLVTIYYVAVRLCEYALTLLMQATGITGPIFTELHTKEKNEELRQVLNIFIKIDVVLALVFISGFILIGYNFIELWMTESFDTKTAYICLIVLFFGKSFQYFSSPIQSLLMTVNKHKLGAIVSMGETALSVILCFLLIPHFGAAGAAFSITIPIFFGRVLILPVLANSAFSLELSRSISRISAFILISLGLAISTFRSGSLSNANSITSLALIALAIATAQVFIGGIMFTKSEYKLFYTKIRYRFIKSRGSITNGGDTHQ